MNIFAIYSDPILSAMHLPDEYVKSKMIIESAIMLQHCFTPERLAADDCPRTKSGNPRKSGKGYFNHPSSQWVRESSNNMYWLVHHAKEMCKERARRFPGAVPHFTELFIDWCGRNIEESVIPRGLLTPFKGVFTKGSTCLEIEGFNKKHVCEQYRLYIKHDKPFATWTGRDRPEWC